MNGSSDDPIHGIWIRWSITENHVKPLFSAHCAFAFRPSNISYASGPKTKDGLWMPNFMETSFDCRVQRCAWRCVKAKWSGWPPLQPAPTVDTIQPKLFG